MLDNRIAQKGHSQKLCHFPTLFRFHLLKATKAHNNQSIQILRIFSQSKWKQQHFPTLNIFVVQSSHHIKRPIFSSIEMEIFQWLPSIFFFFHIFNLISFLIVWFFSSTIYFQISPKRQQKSQNGRQRENDFWTENCIKLKIATRYRWV